MKTKVLTYTGTRNDLNNYLDHIGRYEVLGVQLTSGGDGHVDHTVIRWLITVREKEKVRSKPIAPREFYGEAMWPARRQELLRLAA